jgi:hypothetical protein
VEKRFDLKDAKSTFEFVFWLYNFVSVAKEENTTLSKPYENLVKLGSDVKAWYASSLSAAHNDDAANGKSKKPRNNGPRAQNLALSDMAIQEALDCAGYTIPKEPWGLFPVRVFLFMKRTTIDLALQSTDKICPAISAYGKSVMLKLTDEHEVEVLRRLHNNQSTKQTRIIPLLDVVDRTVMVLPLRTPLKVFLMHEDSHGDVGQLAQQFLEGVEYLHNSSVAHLDLKPDNIVVQRDPESKKVDLTIIDFNLSVFADVEPTISTSYGTEGWCAPEVSAGEPYDPILADRWSCGCVVMFFTEFMESSPQRRRMCISAQRLMDPNPSLRPPIQEI